MNEPAQAQIEPEKTLKIPPIEELMANLLINIAEESRPCRACGATLAMVRHRNGKIAPYTMRGLNHFIDCPGAAQFRKGAGR